MQEPLCPAGTVSTSTSIGWKAAFATGTVQSRSRSLHCPASKDELFRLGSLLASHKPLGGLDSASWEILQLSDPSSAPLCQPGSLSDYGEAMFPTTATKAGEPQRSALAQKPHSPAAGWQHPGPHAHAPAPLYLGGITTIGCPRLGLHMRTWASLALGFTSAFGGMGSILLRIRGCSC